MTGSIIGWIDWTLRRLWRVVVFTRHFIPLIYMAIVLTFTSFWQGPVYVAEFIKDEFMYAAEKIGCPSRLAERLEPVMYVLAWIILVITWILTGIFISAGLLILL